MVHDGDQWHFVVNAAINFPSHKFLGICISSVWETAPLTSVSQPVSLSVCFVCVVCLFVVILNISKVRLTSNEHFHLAVPRHSRISFSHV